MGDKRVDSEVSGLAENSEHVDTDRSQSRFDTATVLLPTHPFTLTLPQLNLDGTVAEHDLTSHQSSPYPYTPPAALSSLGARARMAGNEGRTMDGTASFVDEQYDMIDDLSEISNDDHETASITSGSAGRATPDLVESLPNLDEAINDDNPTMQSRVESILRHSEMQAMRNNRVQDDASELAMSSFVSEELETPRQSIITMRMPLTGPPDRQSGLDERQSGSNSPVQPNGLRHKTFNILFVSDPSIRRDEMERIVTCAVLAHREDEEETRPMSSTHNRPEDYSLSFYTDSPVGTDLPTAELIHRTEQRVASVYHCTGAQCRTKSSYSLQIRDADDLHSTNYTLGKDGKIDLPLPDFAIIYLRMRPIRGNTWLETAHKAVTSLKLPIIVVRGPHFYHGSSRNQSRCLVTSTSKQVQVDGKSFDARVHTDAVATIRQLLQHKPVSSFGTNFLKWLVGTLALTTLACCFLPMFSSLPGLSVDSFELLQYRRSELVKAVPALQSSSVHHLLPDYMADCFAINVVGLQHTNTSVTEGGHNCSSVYVDVLSANSLILALPGLSHFPRLTSTHVYKKYTGGLLHNTTQLIPGVWEVSIDPDSAYGVVYINMVTAYPALNVTSRHHFGGAGSDAVREVGRVLAKDAAVAKDLAHGVTDTVRDHVERVRDQMDQVYHHVERMAQIAMEWKWSYNWTNWERNTRELGSEILDEVKSRIDLSRERAQQIHFRLVTKVARAYYELRRKVETKREARLEKRAAKEEGRLERRKAKLVKRGRRAQKLAKAD